MLVDTGQLVMAIKSKYGSIHALAKHRPGGLARSTLYQVLAGKYAGDTQKQLKRLADFLESGPPVENAVFETLKEVACGLCKRRPKRRKICQKCFSLWQRQAEALRGMGVENGQGK